MKIKMKFSLQHSKLLKIVPFMTYCALFTTANANLPNTNDQLNKPEVDSHYFLDIDRLQSLNTSADIIYVEKDDNNAKWVIIPIKNFESYYKTVAAVVATEIYKRLDEQALIPFTKFLIKENTNNHNWQLIGHAYKKNSYTAISEVNKNYFLDYSNVFYNKHNIERYIGVWRYLGLPTAPNPTILELSLQDNKLIRYDYDNALQYTKNKIREKCFCTSYSKISDYKCDIEYIENFEQELRSRHKEMLEKIISEIRGDSKKYLEGEGLQAVNQALVRILERQTLK